jgi:hypothetical protein
MLPLAVVGGVSSNQAGNRDLGDQEADSEQH